MWLSRELSKASVAKAILTGLDQRSDLPSYRVLPSQELDLLIVSDETVVGVEISLGQWDSSLSYSALGRLERASYLLASQFPDRHLFLALMTNMVVSARSHQLLNELGVQLFHMAEARPEAVPVASLMLARRPLLT